MTAFEIYKRIKTIGIAKDYVPSLPQTNSSSTCDVDRNTNKTQTLTVKSSLQTTSTSNYVSQSKENLQYVKPVYRDDESKRNNTSGRIAGGSSFDKKMLRTFITVSIILAEYIICFGPAAIMLIVYPLKRDISVAIRGISFTLPILNSLLNPFLYAWRLPDFRKYLKCWC